jgi:3'(2'), 5'-bisphosphate nucleotidase
MLGNTILLSTFIHEIKKAAQEAGKCVTPFFGKKIEEHTKKDLSPVTAADKASHYSLLTNLKTILDVPILSEENSEDYTFSTRKLWEKYWLIDPLDGTKGFLNGCVDFCINIALMEKNKPILGLIYAPITHEMHIGIRGQGTQHFNVCLMPQIMKRPVVAVSRHFHSLKTQDFLDFHCITSIKTIGGALKFGRLAIGEIDMYPRFQGSSEWDIAAGHLIVEEAGGIVIDLNTFDTPLYNKEFMENNHFFACRNKSDLNYARVFIQKSQLIGTPETVVKSFDS